MSWAVHESMTAPVAYLSYLIDTTDRGLDAYDDHASGAVVTAWLTVKVALLVVYVVPGSYALKRQWPYCSSWPA